MVVMVCFFMMTVIDDGSVKVFLMTAVIGMLLDMGSDHVPWQKWITLWWWSANWYLVTRIMRSARMIAMLNLITLIMWFMFLYLLSFQHFNNAYRHSFYAFCFLPLNEFLYPFSVLYCYPYVENIPPFPPFNVATRDRTLKFYNYVYQI